MSETLLQARVEAIRRLTRRGAAGPLSRVLEKSRIEDVAAALTHLTPAEQRRLFRQVTDDESAAQLLVEIGEFDLKNLVQDLSVERLVSLLDYLPVDDETDIIAVLPDEMREQVLKRIQRDDRAQVEELLTYPEDSAGGIMSPVAFKMHEDSSCREAIEALQEAENLETVFYLYLQNDGENLVGVTSLRSLLTHSPNTRLGDLMTTDVIAVTPEVDQEEVARIVSRYDMLAVPVVDEHRRMLGIVTVDDVIDVIHEEAAEDMLLMAGLREEGESERGVIVAARQRMLWLFVTLFGGIAMAEVIGAFESSMIAKPVLAGFIPVMMGMGGNVGIQAATIAVRNIATGQSQGISASAMLFREVRVGFVMGLVFALILGVYGWVTADVDLGMAIAVSIVTTVAAAASFGLLVPVTLNRMGVDPAVATGPFVTTGIDVVAIVIYFTTCQAILGL